MKKIIRKYIGLSAILCLALTSCGNTLNETSTPVLETVETIDNSDKTNSVITIAGKIDPTGAVPRSATSSFNQTITWRISAKSADYSFANTADGTSKITQGATASSVSTDKSFSLSLAQTGNWTITVHGFSGDYTNSEIPAGTAALFTGETEINVPAQGLSNLKISVSLQQTGSTATGTISLPMSAPTSIKKVSAILNKYQSDPVYTKEKEAVFTNGNTSLFIEDLPVGKYTATLSFDDANGNTLYTCNEAINVYPGQETDTWFGTAPYLVNDEGTIKFILSQAILDAYGAEIAPKTDILLYDYFMDEANNSEQSYLYYLVNENNLAETPSTTVVTSQGTSYQMDDSTFFDTEGNLYFAQILSDYSYTKLESTKQGWSAPYLRYDESDNLGLEYVNNGYHIITADKTNDSIYAFIITKWDYPNEDNILTIMLNIYLNLISSGGTAFAEDDVNDGINLEYGTSYTLQDVHFAVNNNFIYLAAKALDNESNIVYLIFTYDINTLEEGIKNTSYTDLKIIPMNTLLDVQNDCGSITDALYQDGNLYILYKEGLPFSDSFGSELYSRGAVIRYNLLTKSFDSTGFTTSKIAKDSGFKMTPVGAIYGINYPLYTNTGLTERFLPETDEAGIDVSTKYPDIYRPEDAEKAFYGPTRFIAIKPKKLVIADEGFAFYTEDDGLLRYKNVNRVVYVDLEDFVVSETKAINSNLSLSQDDTNKVLHGSGSDSISLNAETTYYTSAPGEYRNMSCYLGIINGDVE